MSDAGVLEAVEAELVALARGADEGGVARIETSLTVEDLVQMDAEGQMPAILVAYQGYQERGESPIGSKVFYPQAIFEIATVHRDERSASDARTAALATISLLRDRINNVRTAITVPAHPGRYLFQSESVERISEALVAARAHVRIKLRLGN